MGFLFYDYVLPTSNQCQIPRISSNNYIALNVVTKQVGYVAETRYSLGSRIPSFLL